MTFSNKKMALILAALLAVSAIGTFVPMPLISAPSGLLFGVILPGSILWLLLTTQRVRLWTSIVYIGGLGVIFNMLIGAMTSAIGQTIGLDKPFSHITLLCGYGVVSLLFLILYRFSPKKVFSIRKPAINRESFIIFVTTIIMVGCIILGAASLNNGGSGVLTLIFFIYVPIITLYLVIRSKHINENVLIGILYLLGYGLMLSGWLRSSFISGPDISLEYAISELTKSSNLWSLSLFKSAYNSCLSVGVLSPSISILTNISIIAVYKVIIPMIYCLVVPIVYLIAKKYSDVRPSIIAASFFIAQPVFVVWWWIPTRQEIAFLLFGLIVLTLFNTFTAARKIYVREALLFITLGCGLVVAHYSTAVLSIAYLFVAWIVFKIAVRRLPNAVDFNFVNIKYIFLFVATYIAWYGYITYGMSGLTEFVTKSSSKLSQADTQKHPAKGTDFLSQFALFATHGETTVTVPDYIAQREKIAANYYGQRNLYNVDSSLFIHKAKPQKQSPSEEFISTIRKLIIILGKIGLIMSVTILTYKCLRKRTNPEFLSIVPAALILLGVTILLPSFSVSYDQVRTYQQMLIIMGGLAGLVLFLKPRYRTRALIGVMFFVSIYFVLVTNMLSYFNTSPAIPAGLANRGNDYDSYYVSQSEVSAGKWLSQRHKPGEPISGDSYSRNKLRITLNPNVSQTISTTLVPSALPKEGYVVAMNINNQKHIAYATVDGGLIIYDYPFDFIESNKNTVYSNGLATLYR